MNDKAIQALQSAPNDLDILHFQRLAACCGYYLGKLDGIWGPKTAAALNEWNFEYSRNIAQSGIPLTKDTLRTRKAIELLLPQAQRTCLSMLSYINALAEVTASNIDVKIISGTRTYKEQQELYNQGRYHNQGQYGRKAPIVTNSRPGQSYHNFGIAWDIGIFKAGKYLPESSLYSSLGAHVAVQYPDIEWGGTWKTFKDRPHYQMRLRKEIEISDIRARFEKGMSYYDLLEMETV